MQAPAVSWGEVVIMLILISQGYAAQMLWTKVCNIEQMLKDKP